MIIHHDQVGFISQMQRWFNICKPMNVIYHIKEDESYNNLNFCRKVLLQNSITIHDKNSQSQYRENMSQHNKVHLWQIHS